MEKVKSYLKNAYERFMAMDKKKRTYLIAIVGVVIVMMWAFISAGVITSNFNRSKLKNSENEQKVDALGVIITETKEGTKYFEIYGETGHYSNDHSIATLYNVIGNFYKDNEVAMSFQSSKGTYNENTGVITLYENTYIVLKDGVSLKTDKLVWSGSDKETVAEGNVIIKKNDEMVSTANKGIISAGYEKFKIIGKTQTKIYEKKQKTP
jgi:LPS export ABC transporter protein LptC